MKSELTEQILELQRGDHLCLFYEKDPAEQMPALLPFIQDGLAKDEQFIYVADDQTVDELTERLQQSGVNVDSETRRGALKLWTRREWRQAGQLCSEKKSMQVLNTINESLRCGFKGSRFAVEMTWTLGPDISSELLAHWEATLNDIFVPGSQGRIICQYNRSRLSSDVLFAALHTHPLAILGDHIYPNVFYAAPLILKGDNGKSTRVDWMISQLKRARAAQKQREELIQKNAALAESELSKKKIENILSVMPVAVYTCDEEGRITYFNQRAAELWGREPCLYDNEEKFCGSFRLCRSDGALLPDQETPMARAIRSGECTRDQEVVIERPDGSHVVASVNINPLFDGEGRFCGAINAFQDITARKQTETDLRHAKADLADINAQLEARVQERTIALERAHAALLCEFEEQRRLEEQLRHAQKMESVGTLAGGIAHDFNNILNIIGGYSSLIRRRAPENQTIGEGLRVIEEEVERGAAVVRQLLTLARKTEAQRVVININDAVSQLSSLLKQIFPKHIEVLLNLAPGLPHVLADCNQIRQALLNICVNARDAMPNGGRVTLSTSLIDETTSAGIGRGRTKRYVCVETADTGFGMNESIRDRIFEPFFTTKGIGKGTGLGLAMVYGIVRNHDGFVKVESEPERGATFRLYFPVASTADTSVVPAVERKSPERRNGVAPAGTILIAEDEAPMADLLERTFTECGHRVLLARDGDQAMDLYGTHQEEVDAVLLDIGLPKASGWDVIAGIKEKHPEANIIVASGYLEPAIKSKMYQLGVKDFINKPYAPESVVAKVESVMRKSYLN